MNIRGQAAIVGIGAAGCGEAPGWSATELMALAAQNAITDAGLKLSDIDGVLAATGSHAFPTLSISEYLGLRPRFQDGTNIGGSSFEAHLISASMALMTGQCNAALICYGSNQRSSGGKFTAMSEPQPHEAPYKPRPAMTAYALAASRHMHAFGTTRRMLAEVAVAARQWANLNPAAFARGPLSLADVLDSRMVSDPLTSRDCCLVTDGGGACVLVRTDHARDLPHKPVYVLGAASAGWHRGVTCMPDLTTTAATESGARAYAMSGLAPRDIKLAMVYDAFTINTILFLEDLGFCPKGEGGRFVQDGAIGPGGRLAVNTNGGGLSCLHPGMYGMFLILEAVTQLRGHAQERQIQDLETALVHGNGGTLSSQCTAVLGTSL